MMHARPALRCAAPERCDRWSPATLLVLLICRLGLNSSASEQLSLGSATS